MAKETGTDTILGPRNLNTRMPLVLRESSDALLVFTKGGDQFFMLVCIVDAILAVENEAGRVVID